MDERRKLGKWLAVVGLLGLAIVVLVMVLPAAALGEKDFIGGLVYIDTNLNGKWDVGEPGYGGYEGAIKEVDGWVNRYIGTTVTFTGIGSGPKDPLVLESAPYREPEKHEKEGLTCTPQDFKQALDENREAVRPCEGTFGMISYADDVTWEVSIEVPEGYELTSDPVLRFMTGESVPFCDFGITPVE